MSHSMSIPTANGAPHFDKARNNFGRPLGHYKSITKGFPLLSSFRLAAPSSCRWKDRLDACMENHVMQATRLPARDRGLVFFSFLRLLFLVRPLLAMACAIIRPTQQLCLFLLHLPPCMHAPQSSKSSSRDHSVSPTRRNSAPAANCPLASHACMVAWS